MGRKQSLHICIIVWFFPKLSETFILNQIIGLKKKGCRVTIIAVKNPAQHLASEDYEFERVVHSEIRDYRLKAAFYGSPQKIASYLLKHKNIFDIVYFQFHDLAVNTLKYCKLPMPIFISVHNIVSPKNRLTYLKEKRDFYFLASQKNNYLLPITEYTHRKILQSGYPRHRIFIQRMGVNLPIKGNTRKKVSHKAKKFIFLIVARFVEKKGIDVVLQAIRLLIAENKKITFRLVIIGDGILKTEIDQMINKFGIGSFVKITGKLPGDKVKDWMINSDCLICPSKISSTGEEEGFPVVILEAMSVGLPVIASRHAAIPEIVSNGETGFLVPENNTVELKRMMAYVMKNRKVLTFCAKNARRIVFGDFNIDILIQLLICRFQISRILDQIKSCLYLPTKVKNIIRSVTIVGSFSKMEMVTPESDIDIIIICRKSILPYEIFEYLNTSFKKIKLSGMFMPSPQIFNNDDLQLLSPVLTKNFLATGFTIEGKSLKEILPNSAYFFAEKTYDRFLLKRILFIRFYTRQFLVNTTHNDLEKVHFLAKHVLFQAGHYLELSEAGFYTSRYEIANIFSKKCKNVLPLSAYGILEGNNETYDKKLFCRKAAKFIEEIGRKSILFYHKKYPKQSIVIPTF